MKEISGANCNQVASSQIPTLEVAWGHPLRPLKVQNEPKCRFYVKKSFFYRNKRDGDVSLSEQLYSVLLIKTEEI